MQYVTVLKVIIVQRKVFCVSHNYCKYEIIMRRVEPIIGHVSDTAWQVNLNQSCGDRALNTDRYTNSVEFEGGGRKL